MGTGRRSSIAVAAALVAAAAAWLAWPRGGDAPRSGEAVGGGAPRDAPVPPGLAAAQPGQHSGAGAGMSSDAEAAAAAAPWRFRVVAADSGAAVAGATISEGAGVLLGQSDADGRLAVDGSRSEPGSFAWVVVRARGFGLAAATAERGKECEVRLARGVTVHGRCLVAGAPVSGARVTVTDEGSWTAVAERVPVDEGGRYRVEGVAAGAPVHVLARAPGRANAETRAAAKAPENEVDVRFEEGGILDGTVTDSHGRPLPSVPVAILAFETRADEIWVDGPAFPEPAGRSDKRASSLLSAPVETDERGRYEIRGIPVEADFTPIARPSLLHFVRGERVRFGAVGERLKRDIRVPDPGGLVVRILGWSAALRDRAEFGVYGSDVHFHGRVGRREGAESWHFDGLAPGAYHVAVGGYGFPVTFQGVEVRSGAIAEAIVDFGGLTAVEGTVVSEAGKPVPAAFVWWASPTASAFATTDEAGRFRFDGLERTPGRLVAEGRTDPPSARAWREGVEPGGQSVTLVLPSAAWLRMAVANVDPKNVRAILWWPVFQDRGVPTEHRGDRAIDLRACLLGVPGHAILLSSGYARVVLPFPALRAGETHDLGVVRFDEGRTVEVVVVGPDGQPPPKAEVNGTPADEAGRVTLEHRPRAALPVAVQAEGWPPHAFTIPEDARTPVTLRLGPLGTLEVHVLRRDGTPARDARVHLRPSEDWILEDSDLGTIYGPTGAEGVFREPLQARTYRIEARTLDGGLRSSPTTHVTVAPDTTTTVTIRLP